MKPQHIVFVPLAADYMTAVGAFSLIMSEMNRFPTHFIENWNAGMYNVCLFFVQCLYHVYSVCIYVAHIWKLAGFKMIHVLSKPLMKDFASMVPSVDASNSWFQLTHLLVSCTRTSMDWFWDQVSYSNLIQRTANMSGWFPSWTVKRCEDS